MRRKGLVERNPNGSWNVGQDFLEKAKQYEKTMMGHQPFSLTIRSHLPLNQLPPYDGPTWLDQMIVTNDAKSFSNVHFGTDVIKAIRARQNWLIDQGFGKFKGNQFVAKTDFMKTLQQRELQRTGATLSKQHNRNFVEPQQHQKIEGIYKRPIQLAMNKYALIERGRDITLVPWRPILERARGKVVSGVMRSKGVSWDITKKRGINLGNLG